MQFDASRQRIEEASALVAGGVNSAFRQGIAPHPLVFTAADGPILTDLDGNRLIDYFLGMGPMLLGHRPAPVVEAARAQLDRSILVAGQTELEYAAAQILADLVPSAELVRFAVSGSEAVQAALRVARAVTGRSTVVKFEGTTTAGSTTSSGAWRPIWVTRGRPRRRYRYPGRLGSSRRTAWWCCPGTPRSRWPSASRRTTSPR
ncbi:aminotransferase class III-fold pyridoxal phosphate-dependent enzyme [Phytohabitans flavus]|uniref:aminotransferase class III-fold pyridoxal phosphate-dependent enzyme n=1 Tax=Phytohabitans flavus TaxID=1076124 RepID=UPI0036273BA2